MADAPDAIVPVPTQEEEEDDVEATGRERKLTEKGRQYQLDTWDAERKSLY